MNQLELELQMACGGLSRDLKKENRAKSMKQEHTLPAGQKLLRKFAAKIIKELRAFKTKCARTKKKSNIPPIYDIIKPADPSMLAAITMREMLAGISKPRTRQSIAASIGRDVEAELRLGALLKSNRNEAKKLIKALRREENSSQTGIVLGTRKSKLNREDLLPRWANADHIKVGFFLIDIALTVCHGSLSDGPPKPLFLRETHHSSARGRHNLKTTISHGPLADEVFSEQIHSTAYMPCVERPLDWTSPWDGGYHSDYVSNYALVRGMGIEGLRELAKADLTQVYKALNLIQSNAWEVNRPMLNVLREAKTQIDQAALTGKDVHWRLSRALCSGVNWALPEGVPREHKDHKKILSKRKEIRKRNARHASKRIHLNRLICTVEQYDKEFYVVHNLDFRGRVYALGNLSLQDIEWGRSLLQFANGAPLGDKGLFWLAVQGANSWAKNGLDKKSLQDRVNWVLKHTHSILKCASEPWKHRAWWHAEDPFLFLAFCQEWAALCQHISNDGKEVEFISKLPVFLDGSCSGIQHWSAMLRDAEGGKLVNLVPSDLPGDIYSAVAKNLKELLTEENSEGALKWLEFGVTRKVTKRPTMTTPYSASRAGIVNQTMEDILEPAQEDFEEGRRKELPWGQDIFEGAFFLAPRLMDAIAKTVKGAVGGMDYTKRVAAIAAKANKPVRWVNPVGFPVVSDCPKYKSQRIRCRILKGLDECLIRIPTGEQSTKDALNSVAPHFVHSMDSAHLMLTVLALAELGIHQIGVIHDSFATVPGHVETMRNTLLDQFTKMYSEHDPLTDLVVGMLDVLGNEGIQLLQEMPQKGSLDLQEIKKCQYAFA